MINRDPFGTAISIDFDGGSLRIDPAIPGVLHFTIQTPDGQITGVHSEFGLSASVRAEKVSVDGEGVEDEDPGNVLVGRFGGKK